MADSRLCPDATRWRQLLDGYLSEHDQEELNHHLEACARCQQTLDNLTASNQSWADVARHLGDAQSAVARASSPNTSTNPTVDPSLDPLDDNDANLGFLQPSDKPESLGRLGHYEILEVIGRGGMGIVLRAFDEKLHRVVAIKVMAPQLATTSPPRKRFLREARAAAAVRHEHVVAIHAVEEQPIPVPGHGVHSRRDLAAEA